MAALHVEREEEASPLQQTVAPDDPNSVRRTGVWLRRKAAIVTVLVAFSACVSLASYAVPARLPDVAMGSGKAAQRSSGETPASQALVMEVWPPPSLFCWLAFQSAQPEAGLVRMQFNHRSGIFACDAFVAFSDTPAEVGTFPNGWKFMSMPVGSMAAERASWGVINMQQFKKIWDKIFVDGHYQKYDFVVKVDPDTVFFPGRLQRHLQQVPTGACFFRNSNAGDGVPMVGPLEVVSKTAVDEYGPRSNVCKFPPKPMGEDNWISWCMRTLGVAERTDLQLLKNGMNYRAGPEGCEGALTPAFHPFKDRNSWLRCESRAER